MHVADASVDLLVERVAQCDGSVVGLTDVNIGGQLDVVREFSPAPEHIPTGAPTSRSRADQARVVRSRQRRVGLRLVQLGVNQAGAGERLADLVAAYAAVAEAAGALADALEAAGE